MMFTVSTGSVTVYATGNITIRGDIEATGTNSAGGPNVVALISETGDIIIDPGDASTAVCLIGSSHSLNLSNVAVLAPAGAMFAPAWHKSTCAGHPDSILRFKGSLAAHHLGIYGQLAEDGTHLSGWKKEFTYPPDDPSTLNVDESFWLARPPWWPDYSGNEWAPTEAVQSSSSGAATTSPPPPQPGLTVNQTSITVTEGSATPVHFEVSLATQPSADVTINVDQTPSATLFVTPSVLTFTPTDWDIAGYVTVDASVYQDNDTIDTRITVSLTATSTDSDYDGLSEDLTVVIRDDDIPDLVMAPASLAINETGSDMFTVSLSTAPFHPVTVTIVSDDSNAATAMPASLTFDASNFDTDQTVTVTGVNDPDADDESLNISLTAASTDTDYDTMTGSVSVVVTDDETHGLVGVPDTLTVDENGTTTFDVSLTAQPSADVSVTTYSLTTSAVTVNPSPLTFTTTNWGTPQNHHSYRRRRHQHD